MMRKKFAGFMALLLTAACLGGCSAPGETETIPENAPAEITEAVSETEETTAETTETIAETTEEITTTAEKKFYCPDVVGMQQEEAVKVLEDLGLAVTIVKETDCRIVQDTVLKQSVKKDKKVVPGSEITITVSEWGEKYYLLKSEDTLSKWEADNGFVYTYDERGLLTSVTFNMYNSFMGDTWGEDYRLMYSDEYLLEYNDDLSEVSVHHNHSDIDVDGEITTKSNDDSCHYDGINLTKAAEGEELTRFNSVTPQNVVNSNNRWLDDDYYTCEYSYDDSGNISRLIIKRGDDTEQDSTYSYESIASENMDKTIANLNSLLIYSIYPASGFWFR